MPLKPIRVGDAFTRTYRRKNADGTPLVMSGSTVTFNLKSRGTIHTYTSSGGAAVDTEAGIVNVVLTSLQTSLWIPDRKATSWLEITDGAGDVITRALCLEKIIARGES